MHAQALLLLPLLVPARAPLPLPALAPAHLQAAAGAETSPLSGAEVTAVQEALDELVASTGTPGASFALLLPEGEEVTWTSGLADADEETPLTPAHRLLAGSIGKTYVSAAALHLVSRGLLELDAPASQYLGDEEWFAEVPNGADVTVRQLLRHQSGIPRYVEERAFWRDLVSDPDRTFEPVELVAYVFGHEPRFPAGEGFAYADTNYLLVGLILEKVSGEAFYDYVKERLLAPHGLVDTVPSDSRRMEHMAQGHVVMSRRFGVGPRTLEKGVFTFNPQFEWCGGGWATTPLDLARWARIVYEGRLFDGEYLDELLDGVPAPELGPGMRYGLGVMIGDSPLGRAVGHDGFMPGYVSCVRHFPDAGLTAALQLDTDDLASVGSLERRLVDLAGLVGS